jgi:hypothetical protein
VGTVGFDGDKGIARTLAEQSSDFGLRNAPAYYGKVLDPSIELQHKELSNLIHPPPPIHPQLEVWSPRADDFDPTDETLSRKRNSCKFFAEAKALSSRRSRRTRSDAVPDDPSGRQTAAASHERCA